MRIGFTLCTLPALLLLSACVGEVVITPISPADLITPGKELHGIVGYRAMQVIEVDTLTQFSPDGKTFTTACTHTESDKIVSIPDQQHPLLISYRHGILEGYTFGVTLNADGVITGVNTVSAPDQGKTLSNVASAATDVAKIPFLAASATIACNSSPTFKTYKPVPSTGL